jgi:serine/threonine protein phosphatase PrpC
MGNTWPLRSAALSLISQKRDKNEDTVFHHCQQFDNGEYAGLYLVCDGIGGYQEGDVASQLAAEVVEDRLLPLLQGGAIARMEPNQPLPIHQWTEAAVRAANLRLWQINQDPQSERRIGTTITLALVVDNTAHVAQVGDSRAYIWHQGSLQQITVDHSWAAELAENRIIAQDAIVDHPRSNILSRALGKSEKVKVDLYDWPLEAGNRLLLCSEGLWKVLVREEHLEIPDPGAVGPARLCRSLVEEAAQRDRSDDISVVAVAVG